VSKFSKVSLFSGLKKLKNMWGTRMV
jgi:hypothetical protein